MDDKLIAMLVCVDTPSRIYTWAGALLVDAYVAQSLERAVRLYGNTAAIEVAANYLVTARLVKNDELTELGIQAYEHVTALRALLNKTM